MTLAVFQERNKRKMVPVLPVLQELSVRVSMLQSVPNVMLEHLTLSATRLHVRTVLLDPSLKVKGMRTVLSVPLEAMLMKLAPKSALSAHQGLL